MIVDNDICFQAKLCVFILFSLNVVSSNIVNKCENKFIQSKLFCIFFLRLNCFFISRQSKSLCNKCWEYLQQTEMKKESPFITKRLIY